MMMKLKWTTEKRMVKDLVPYEYNPRILTESRKEKLIASLNKFDVVEIPVINTDNTIIAGHQRIKVLMELERSEEMIDVRVPNRMLTETELKEYNITSNVQVGFWDIDVLEQAFSDIDLGALGLNVDEIEIPDFEPDKKIESEEDFVIVEPKNPISAPGDVFEFHSIDKQLKHIVICGSSVESDVIDTFDCEGKINLTLTDPPYNVDYTGGTSAALKIENDNMDDESFFNFLFDFYSNAFKLSAPGAPIYVFHADSEGANFRSALKKAGYKLSQCLIWLKNSIVLGRQDYHWIHEPILYGWKPGAAHNWYSDRTQRTVVEFDRPTRNEEHPTMKPLPLVEYFLLNSSRRYDLVFDGFLGSGSTLIGCEKTKRQCRGTEIMPAFMDVIVTRWLKYMIDNGLDFKIVRNGIELHEEEIQKYYQK